jgi:hypothetical protein
MKIIVSLRHSDGTFPEVGMNNRTIFDGKSVSHILRRAANYANGRAYRVEFFANGIFKDATKTVTFEGTTK